MPGFGFGEIVVIAVVLLVAVGPQRLPQLMRTVGQSLRQFRDAATELRRASGIDEIMREDPLGMRRPAGRPRNPLGPLSSGTGGAPAAGAAGATAAADPVAAGRADPPMTAEAVHREYPPEGVDVAHARAHPAATDTTASPPEGADPGRSAGGTRNQDEGPSAASPSPGGAADAEAPSGEKPA